MTESKGMPLQVSYSDCQERTETLLVYSLEEMLAEKLCTVLGRTEPRDLYDTLPAHQAIG